MIDKCAWVYGRAHVLTRLQQLHEWSTELLMTELRAALFEDLVWFVQTHFN